MKNSKSFWGLEHPQANGIYGYVSERAGLSFNDGLYLWRKI